MMTTHTLPPRGTQERVDMIRRLSPGELYFALLAEGRREQARQEKRNRELEKDPNWRRFVPTFARASSF